MNWSENLTSVSVSPGAPWLFDDRSVIPAEVRKDKRARTAWLQRAQTAYHIYSLWEGVNPNLRIGEDNPPLYLYGFAVDYDHPSTDEQVDTAIKEASIKPNWVERTLSGNVRIVYVLTEKFRVPSDKQILRLFLEKALEALHLRFFRPGLDEKAFFNYSLRFTNGACWRKVEADLLSTTLARGWMVQALTADHGGDSRRLAVSLDKVAERLAERYPRFTEWPGNFDLGVSGPSFWVAGSTSPNSAIVREEGLFTFAAHAHKSFYSWPEILGDEWFEQACATNLGKAVENIWYDGKHYWVPSTDGIFRSDNKEQTVLFLRSSRGLSIVRARGKSLSPLEEALSYINLNQRVDGAAPFAGRPHGIIIEYQGDQVLNTSRTKPVVPASEAAEWGKHFPTIAMLIDGLFGYCPEAKDALLAEYWYFQKHLQSWRPVNGHNLIIMGEPGGGKTLLNQRVLGHCAGGYANASKFLNGEDNFGSELFHVSWWCNDDGTNIGKNHRHYSEMVKSAAANPSFRFNAKYRPATLVEWLGRLCITLNCDLESQLQLPNLNNSSWEKVSLFRTDPEAREKIKFRHSTEMEPDIERECPHFLAWLLSQTPEKDKWLADRMGDVRYGVTEFHDPSMRESVQQSSNAYVFSELLDIYLREYFKATAPNAEFWEGLAAQLHIEMTSNPGMQVSMRKMDAIDVGRYLASLRSSDFPITERTEGGKRLWRIARPEDLPKPRPVEVSSTTNSPKFDRFDKQSADEQSAEIHAVRREASSESTEGESRSTG